MTSKVQVTFRRSQPSEIARDLVTEKFARLAHQLPYTARCHVVLDRPSRSHHKGTQFTARVDIEGAGMPLSTEAANRDPYAAIRAAFERVETQAQRVRDSYSSSRTRAHKARSDAWH